MAVSTVIVASVLNACGPFHAASVSRNVGAAKTPARTGLIKPDARRAAIARAQLWRPTNVRAMSIDAGAADPGGFPFRATINCSYAPRDMSGASPKFSCLLGQDDELKVKYGGANAEVYGEVLATRLLWALGFGADRMYSVRVICKGCPREFAGIARENGEYVFDPAAV
jgi:hypothetical protein